MAVSTATTGDLFTKPPAPAYPGEGAQAAAARRFLAWRLNLGDIGGMAFYASPDAVLRAQIENYGECVLAGRGPNGKPESIRALFERCIGPWKQPKVPKGGVPKRWGR